MNPRNPANTRRSQPKEQSTTEETPDQLPEPEPPADETPAAQEESPEQTGAPAPTAASAAEQNATVQAIESLFSELGGIAKNAALPAPAGGDSHNIITINVAVLIGNNQWAGNVDGGIGGTITSSHGL